MSLVSEAGVSLKRFCVTNYDQGTVNRQAQGVDSTIGEDRIGLRTPTGAFCRPDESKRLPVGQWRRSDSIYKGYFYCSMAAPIIFMLDWM
jgi:hypothetical protein